MHVAPILTEEELEKCENPYEEIAKMAKGLVEELKEKEYDRGYEKGMEDAWEVAKAVVECNNRWKLDIFDLRNIFGEAANRYLIISDFSAKEAKEKIDNYIKNKNAEFHVGDEVTFCDKKFIVTRIEEDSDNTLCAIGADGLITYFNKFNQLTKTGRHFDEVEKLLKMLKED